jgi:hypothetical protein
MAKAPAKVQTRLEATTRLSPDEALNVVREASRAVKGGGKGILTAGAVAGVGGLANVGAAVHVEESGPNSLGLSITSGKRVVELCTFKASCEQADGATALRVGGLTTYKATQSTALGFIPIGPKVVMGFDPYKRLLAAVESGLKQRDPTATVTIGIPAA